MYHLLVSYRGWAEDRDTVDRSRIFEYTSDRIAEDFVSEGGFDVARISNIPALFVNETGGSGPQEARVGHITDLRQDNSEVRIEYRYDPDIDPIPNPVLESISGRLDIGEYEFTRSHWAIKDVDLYKALLKSRPVAPSFSSQVFELDESERVRPDLISVMMPFASEFRPVYNALQTLAEDLGAECLRADDIWEHDTIIQDVISLINRSKVVICDCTHKNPNVFYEAGITHAIGKNAILITQSKKDVPFDLQHLRFVKYLNNGEGLQKLTENLKPRVRTLLNQ
jgi:hypothetical protein